jgi:putative transposase
MLKAYRYRMYPNQEQRILIAKHIGSCRFVYNNSLQQKIKQYQKDGTALSCYELNNRLPALKDQYPWLKEVNSQSLQWANKNLDTAFVRFFREKTGFPTFKSKKHKVQSFQVPQHYKIGDNRVKLPKIGWVKTKVHRAISSTLKVATVTVTPTGKYFISISFDDGNKQPEKVPYDESTTVGIDVGLMHYAVLSDSTKVENPRNLRQSLASLQYHQRRLSRKVKGSNNWKKCKQRVARLHEKVANRRRDFQHKLSSQIVRENQAVAVESLNVAGMVRNHNLALSVADAAWSIFLAMIQYKCDWYGKSYIKIGRFDPSSKICSVCGHYHDMDLSVREWTCPACGTAHDRDINAAVNIKKFALHKQNLIGTGLERPGEPADSGTIVPGMMQEAPTARWG